MKKLMVMAVMMGLGLAAHATISIAWEASGVTGYNTDTLYSGDVTLYVTVYDKMDQSVEGTLSASMKSGSINVEGATFDTGGNIAEVCLREVRAYYEMTDGAGNIFSSGEMSYSGDILEENKQAVFNFANQGSWTATIPEPTSGILLLIGLAGVALKRKRA